MRDMKSNSHGIQLLESLYKRKEFDKIHMVMSNNSQTPVLITSTMRVWYGKLLETLGEDTDADKQYMLAERDGGVDRLRNCLKMGCTITEAIQQVTQANNPQTAAFLARFLESSYPDEPSLYESILRLYCSGNCVDYGALFALNHGDSMIEAFLSVIEDERLLPPWKKVDVILSHFEDVEDYVKKIRLLAATSDGAAQAIQECVKRNQPNALRDMLRRNRFTNDLRASTTYSHMRDDIIKMIHSLDDPQLLFDFYISEGTQNDGAVCQLYVEYISFTTISRLATQPENIHVNEVNLNELASRAIEANTPEVIRTLAKYSNHCGLFHISCKLWTKVREPVNAMDALIQGGDIEAVASYATSSDSNSVHRRAILYLSRINSRTLFVRTVIQELIGRLDISLDDSE